MTTPSSSKDTRARRVLVTLVITTAAAAVTAGVALQKHHPVEAVVQRAEAGPAPSESAAPSINGLPDAGATRTDPSLPSAGDALDRASSASEEPATF